MGLLSFYKQPQPRGYDRGDYLVEDTSERSPDYFRVSEFPTIVGGGRYLMKVKGNGANLRTDTTIDVEIIDAAGNNIFAEVVDYVDRFDDYYITIEIYDITPRGLATVYLVGEAIVDLEGNPIPEPLKREYNVRWSSTINVLPFERNTAELVFNEAPKVSITQVTTPEREYVAAEETGSAYSVYTSSIDDYTIVSSNFKGYDRDFGSGKDILDVRLQSLLLNPRQRPSTNNSVNSSLREKSNDIINGYNRELTSRFNTVVTSADRTIQKDFLGGQFTFFDSASTPSILEPTLPSNFVVSGSISEQLKPYTSFIIEVMTDTEMRISEPIEVVTFDTNIPRRGYTTKQRYKKASNFTGSIAYLPSDAAFVTSSTVSQSYLETTFGDLKPISGEVYRIKTYFKKGTSTGDFKLIYDAVVSPVEYLTDAQFPNQTTYAKRDSDFRLIGHFTENAILNSYWENLVETPQAIYPDNVPAINSSSLHESVPIQYDYTSSGLFTTQFNQNYNTGQLYTLSFNVTLDPNTELEIYMTSDPLNVNISVPLTYTRAFLKDPNLERDRYPSPVSRFGKFVGTITNDRNVNKYYGRVEFDFATDASGLGRPVFRSRAVDNADITGNAYVSEISIKPLAINGFSPNIVQYQIPFNNEIESLLSVSQSIDFKIEYFDFTGKQSEFVTYLNDLQVNIKTDIPSNVCQADNFQFMEPLSTESGSIAT